MRSLRVKLLIGTIAGTAFVFAGAGILLYTLVRADLLSQFDRALGDRARSLAGAVEAKPGGLNLDFDAFDMGEFQAPEGPGYLALRLEDGRILYRSPSLGGGDLPATPWNSKAVVFRWVSLPGGVRGRAAVLAFRPRVEQDEEAEEEDDHARGEAGWEAGGEAGSTPANGWSSPPRVVLLAARRTAVLDGALLRLRTLLVIVGVLAVTLSATVLGWVVRRSLEPVGALAARIQGIGEKDLSMIIDLPGTPRELDPVVDRLNRLLQRLDAAFRRERAFSAEVAHELRTPLAGLRSILEVATAQPRDAAAYREALEDCHAVTLRMHAMVEKLLALARLEADRVRLRPEPVSLERLLREAWIPFANEAEVKDLRVSWSMEGRDRIVTDPSLLSMVLRNLLENAVAYADDGGWVTLESRAGEAGMTVIVRNSGSALSGEEARSVFERFWRGDRARDAASGHCGLGLSIARRAVQVLGGSLSVRSEKGGAFTVILVIPGNENPSSSG